MANTKPDSDARGTYYELPELHSSWHKCCIVMVVSDGLGSTFIWSTFS